MFVLLLLSLILLGVLVAPIGAQAKNVPRYEIFEVELTSAKTYANPFMDTTVTATFTAPSGRKLMAYGFHDGGSTWRIRIAPDEEGTWRYTTTASDTSDSGLHNQSGSFRCTASSNKGFIRVDPVFRYYFSFSDSSPFFGMGDTCYGMVTGVGDDQRRHYLDTRSAQKFNFVRFFASGYPFAVHPTLASDATWVWGGSPASPDYNRLNPQFFRRLENILAELRARGMFAEVEVFNYYSKPFTDPAIWTTARQNLWGRYIVSRLSADTTVFLWTVTNEYLCYPDGVYRVDSPSDDDWARSIGLLFHDADPHKHPTTAHPEPRQLPMGPKFGNAAEMDVLTQQQNAYDDAIWMDSPIPGYFEGPATRVGVDIWVDRQYNKPVINTENGYEWLAGYPTLNSGIWV